MAAGFRSPFFFWIGGLSVPTGVVPIVCPCPEYKHDTTLANQFTNEQTLTNQFSKEQTLSNQWKRGGCNG
jgi:hypothetical protein